MFVVRRITMRLPWQQRQQACSSKANLQLVVVVWWNPPSIYVTGHFHSKCKVSHQSHRSRCHAKLFRSCLSRTHDGGVAAHCASAPLDHLLRGDGHRDQMQNALGRTGHVGTDEGPTDPRRGRLSEPNAFQIRSPSSTCVGVSSRLPEVVCHHLPGYSGTRDHKPSEDICLLQFPTCFGHFPRSPRTP
ncbi:unnamed protein product [Protopolystoma xenopodis]|uniref:Uncharacterized protein n=1 Tax=Protopolystoma xenopodis TaxID=117903 RepID=A0A448WKD0_9PLAT|nr:unnamed protein product [Protopolystoma xenopodis]